MSLITSLEKIHDRIHGANLLAEHLEYLRNSKAIVVAIPNGGVPVGSHLAGILNLPLEISFCKKLRHPTDDHCSIGSVTDKQVVLNEDLHDIPNSLIAHQIVMLQRSLNNKKESLGYKESISLEGSTVILVDDRLKNVDTIVGSLQAIQAQKPKNLIVAVPAASRDAAMRIVPLVNSFICPVIFPDNVLANEFYENLPQVTDEDVKEIVLKTRHQPSI